MEERKQRQRKGGGGETERNGSEEEVDGIPARRSKNSPLLPLILLSFSLRAPLLPPPSFRSLGGVTSSDFVLKKEDQVE